MPERLACERIAAKIETLETPARREKESWDAFIERTASIAPAALRVKDLARLTRELWQHESMAGRAREILDGGVGRQRKSLDRAILHSYLFHFPKEHSAFENLVAASALVARRHDWPWLERGTRYRLWSPVDGPSRLAASLLTNDRPEDLLRGAGLDGDLSAGRFAKEAIVTACLTAMSKRGQDAEATGARLVVLFERLKGVADLEGLLAYALLRPWNDETPSQSHQQLLIGLLTARNGDPRIAGARWTALAADIRRWVPDHEAEIAFGNLRRWLVQVTVREFFAIVAKTTDRRDQWKERTDFWLTYLDAGHISDAWFAFGHMAEREARRFLENENLQFGRIEGQGADPSHSSLMMTLGGLRIAEWSHNGACRFWPADHRSAPKLYQKKYFAMVLRTMDAERGLEPLTHQGSWQYKFAKRIFDHTGIRHPRYGAGW